MQTKMQKKNKHANKFPKQELRIYKFTYIYLIQLKFYFVTFGMNLKILSRFCKSDLRLLYIYFLMFLKCIYKKCVYVYDSFNDGRV